LNPCFASSTQATTARNNFPNIIQTVGCGE
jgi:hypothetical protein